MKPKKRQKLCYNCEGEVDLDVIVCPYCAADLRIEKPVQQRALPPINPPSLYPQTHETEELLQENVSTPQSNSTVVSHMLLAFGAQLFMVGLLLLLFSHHGLLILKLNARYWLFYIVASMPLLIFGYRSLSKTS